MGETRPTCLAGDVMPFLDDVGVEQVRTYFDPGEGFSGGSFEAFAGGGDAVGHRQRFTAEDLVAVTLLGVEVSGHGALAILDEYAGELDALLAEVPVDLDLWEAPVDVVDASSAAAALWGLLMTLPDVGWVIAAKLLARKRPRLLPVYDTVVKAALQPDERSFWLPLREELHNGSLVESLAGVRAAAGLDERISLLRILDVAVWMRNRRDSKCPLEFAACPNRTSG